MLIAGEWLLCADGARRPTVRAQVLAADGKKHSEYFLIDSGADRTVFSASLAARLQWPPQSPPAGTGLVGVGGSTGFVLVTTRVEFTRDDGGPAGVQGQFAAFTDPGATDLSVLGRDVLDLFDVLLSRRRDQVLLLAPNHSYQVITP
jgi:hypothetical protein